MDFTILKTLRKAKGFRLKDMAPRIRISSAYLSLIERNQKNPAISIVEDICRELDCELIIKINSTNFKA